MRSTTCALSALCLAATLGGCRQKAETPAGPQGRAAPQKQADAASSGDVAKLVEAATAAKQRKDNAAALKRVDEALAADADNIEANWIKAWLLAATGEMQRAAEQFERVQKLPLDEARKQQAREAVTRLSKPGGQSASATKPTPKQAPAAGSASWPGWLGPNHNGKSPDTGLLQEWPAGGPKLVWSTTGVGKGFSSVAVSNGMVYTAGNVGNQMMVFAFDMNGELKWKVAHDAPWTKSVPGARSTPTIDGSRLYLLSGNGLIGCYEASSGKKIWTRATSAFGGSPSEWGYAESVLIHGNLAIVTPGGERCIVALDKATGKTVWTSSGFSAGAQYGSCIPVTYGGGTMIVAGTHDGIVGVNAKDGRLLWQNRFAAGNTANCPTPAAAERYVFWAVGYDKGGICLKLGGLLGRTTANPAWTTGDMVCHHGGYVLDKGYIYGNNGDGWACLDLKTGRTMWKNGGVGKGSLCYADGMLYLFGEDGGRVGLATCSPQGMELRGTFSVQGNGPSWAHPVVIGGRLYLRYDDNLYCYDVKTD